MESGILRIYHKRVLVYVGKASRKTTKSGRTLRQRLNEHVVKISKHQHITVDEVQVRFLTFESEWWLLRGNLC